MTSERRDKRPRCLSGKRFQDTRLVQSDRAEFIRRKLFEPVVIADVDAWTGLRLIADNAGVVSEPLALGGELMCDGQRRQDQRTTVRRRCCVLCPFQLAKRLTQTGIEEKSARSNAQQEAHAFRL